jgi:glutaminyl-peptide cyclotransferase
MKLIPAAIALASIFGGAADSAPVAATDVQTGGASPFIVVAEFPHDPDAFTQGLAFAKNGAFFEGTGLRGESSVRKVDLTSGAVLKSFDLDDRYFGEGVTIYQGKLWQLTWQEREAFVYRRRSLARIDAFRYRGEGWGLTDHDGELIMSNGRAVIRYRNPTNFKTTRKITVTEDGEPVTNLNELEWIEGEIWANIWQTGRIVRIDPATGEVTGSLDVSELWTTEQNDDPDVGVPNGIAYWANEDRLFVTGKLWHNVYEIRLVDP